MKWKLPPNRFIVLGGKLESQTFRTKVLVSRPYYYPQSPANNDAIVPSGTPGAGISKGKANYVPGSMPSNNTPNGGGVFPGHGGLAPSHTPNPTQIPSNGGGMLPDYAPQPQVPQFLEPQDTPLAREAPRNGVTVTPSTGGIVPITYADITPATITQSTVTRSEGTDALGNYIPPGTQAPISSFALPLSTAQTQKASPVPDAYSPVPKMQLQPVAKTSEQAKTDRIPELLEQQKKDFDEQIKRLTAIATGIAAITSAINNIPNAIADSPSVRAANKDVVQGAVCEISQPGGCLGAPIKQAEDAVKANGKKLNDILTGLNTAGSAAQLALLDTINGKLGDQLPGGIGGKLTRFTQWLQLDRALNILIFVATVQNHLMLSRDIGTTLLSAFSNGLSLIGLKDDSGQAFDLGSIIRSSVENIVKGIIGSENYTSLTETWAKANRIYQATNNVLNSFQNISSTILSGMELIGSYTGKIGNALKKGGEVLDNAYGWMNPQPRFNRISQGLENLQQGASTIQQVTQAPVDVINAVTELQTANTELIKAFKEDDKPENKATPIPEPDKLKADELAAKLNSKISNILPDDLFNTAD